VPVSGRAPAVYSWFVTARDRLCADCPGNVRYQAGRHEGASLVDERGNMPPAQGDDERHAEERSRGERVEEEVSKKPIAEDAGPIGESSDQEGSPEEAERADRPAEAAGQTLGGPDESSQEEADREAASSDEGRDEEDKGLIDKLKDKLRGE
jgi:hypothetical protein